ncbi:MAG TPA: PorV/PorQ family protein [Bacteroidota bacterium]|nr:PorV/PorQ family protein [Bacteroidota bacterium]
MKHALIFLVTIVVASLYVLEADAGNRSGTVSAQFLKIGTSARAIGMGGAQVAIAEGTSSIAYNPAGIMAVNGYGFAATYTSWFAEIDHEYAGIVKSIPGVGAIGASVLMLATDDMIETTTAYPEGTGRTFKASDYAFSIAFGRQVTDQFRVGINGKIIKSYLFNTELGASTFAFDIGTLYDVPVLNSHIGVSLTNIGKDVKFINETYSLPTALRFGVLYDVFRDANQQLISTLQVTRLNDADEQYNFGTEYVFNNMVSLRGGYKFGYDQEDYTFGFGAKLNSLGVNSSIDYGYNHFTYLPGTHSFTLEVQF